MGRASTFQIPVGAEVLRAAAVEAELPHALLEPLQAIVSTISRRAAEAPLSIYICADDDSVDARDAFAFALARTLTAHLPSTLLVDCDFLRPGLNGRVPQKDALGFLDFLLYGSSIGVITQEAPFGVHVVATGSFPVTRRMPFIETAFADAARRLTTHARAVLFVGPLSDDSGGVHALTHAVDIAAVVRGGGGPRADAAEEAIAGSRAEVWSLRLSATPVVERPRPVSPPPAPAPRPVATTPPRAATRPVARAPVREAEDDEEERTSSLAPRIAIIVFGLLVIAFVAWWLSQNRAPGREGDEAADTRSDAGSSLPSGVSAIPVTRGDSLASDSLSAPVRLPLDTMRAPARRRPVNPADTGGRSGGTVLLNAADIHVMDDIERVYRGWHLIHISSFQESIRAREEVAFLQSREFPVFIVFLDLGPKGKWYRVYAGPFATREEARDVKKNLDAISQVRFTRIATIPE